MAEVKSSSSQHTNNWAVLVCTSRYWFNYRHVANALSMYRTVKRLGIPDSNIILMLADDMACNARNQFPGTVFNDQKRLLDLYGDNIEVDYRGYEVTVENFIRLLTGRHEESVPRSKRLLTDDKSNVLVFMTGHGGEEFLKFQDSEELGAQDVADAIAQMFEKQRYNEILLLVDTCQAASMYKRISSPNVLAAASSLTGEPSYSHHADMEIGVSVVDRWTYYNLQTLEKVKRGDKFTIQDLFNAYDKHLIASTPGIRTDLFRRETKETLLTDFFGGVQNIKFTETPYPLMPTQEYDDPYTLHLKKQKQNNLYSNDTTTNNNGEKNDILSNSLRSIPIIHSRISTDGLLFGKHTLRLGHGHLSLDHTLDMELMTRYTLLFVLIVILINKLSN